MKKVLALVASTMMLVVGGLFVSCSDDDDGTKDVYDISVTGWNYAGKFSGTAVTDDKDVTAKVDGDKFGYVSWQESKSNVKEYTLKVPVIVTRSFGSSTSTSKPTLYFTIEKIGSKYYYDDKEVTFSSGSPESSSFTVSAIVYDNYGEEVELKNLSFTRVE